MPKKIRVGFMGATWPCQSHAEGMQNISGIELTAVSEPDEDVRAEFVKKFEKFGPMREYNDYTAMLKDGKLDAVVIGLPTGLHYKATMASLETGRHVLCEKPPTARAAEMIKIAEFSKKKRLTYMFGRQPRFTPSSLAAQKIVKAGKLGDIYHAETKWIRCRGIPLGKGGWSVNKKKGGGVLLDLGIHAIDNAWFVMGCPKPVEVFAGLHCAFPHLAPKGVEYTAEDAAVGIIRFENGATLDLFTTFALNTGGPDVVDAYGLFSPEWEEVKIYGTKAGLDVKAGRLMTGKKDGVELTAIGLPKIPPPVFTAQAEAFFKAIRTGSEPINSPAQAVMLMQMLEALKKSGEKQRAVQL